MKKKNKAIGSFLSICVLFILSLRQVVASNALHCPNAELFSKKILTDICWSCLFPIHIAGINSHHPSVPRGAAKKSLCLCNDSFGVPKPGIVTGMWQPTHLIEVIRKPGCSLVLGGVTLPLGDAYQLGSHGAGDWDVGDLAFYHYHYFSFPVMAMLNMFLTPSCSKDSYLDFDLLFASELDPTWNNDELAFFVHPESVLVATPQAISACITDAIEGSVREPLDALFWCAGSWGHLYPLTGHTLAMGSMAQKTSLIASRALATAHRRGFAQKTMGEKALCRPSFETMLPKSQYKMSMFFPLPETDSFHSMGASTFQWGEWRTLPGVGEDAVYVLWNWQDCCQTGGL